MSRRSLAKLRGAIRLIADADSLGIPILMGAGNNRMFVPEMDYDFRIVKFQSFYNPEGYEIAYDLEKPFLNREYSIGDYAPIPFWLSGQMKTVSGDTEPEHLMERFSEHQRNPLLRDLARIFSEARRGIYLERQKAWHAEDIERRFHDVLDDFPSHARYWVSRYRLAIASARKETQPPHPIDGRLRRAANRWLELFASKTDFDRLASMVGNAKDGVFPATRIRDTLLAFIIHQIANGRLDKLRREMRDEWLTETYPAGIYDHYVRHGWPKAKFSYDRPDNILDPVWTALIDARKSGNYKQAKWLSLLYFGFSDAPKQIEGMIFDQLKAYREILDNNRRASSHIFRDRSLASVWRETAIDMLDTYVLIGDLDYVLNGQSRKEHKISPWLALDEGYLNQLRQYANGDRN